MSKQNERTLNQNQTNQITIDQWDLKRANLILHQLNKFFNQPTFVTPDLTSNTFAQILTHATAAIRINYGPRPEQSK